MSCEGCVSSGSSRRIDSIFVHEQIDPNDLLWKFKIKDWRFDDVGIENSKCRMCQCHNRKENVEKLEYLARTYCCLEVLVLVSIIFWSFLSPLIVWCSNVIRMKISDWKVDLEIDFFQINLLKISIPKSSISGFEILKKFAFSVSS